MTFHSATDSLRQLEAALAASRPGTASGSLRLVSTPAPTGLGRRLIDWQGGHELVGWTAGQKPGDGEPNAVFVGWGAALTLQATGEERFASIKNQLEVVAAKHPQLLAFPGLTRFYGGGRFAVHPSRPSLPPAPPATAPGEADSVFGDALFLLPRVLYADTSEGARLVLITTIEQEASTLALAEEALELLGRVPQPSAPDMTVTSEDNSLPRQAWGELLSLAHEAIERGDFEKVVLARRLSLELSARPRLSDVMARLENHEPSCARFILRVGPRTFLGATPERLVRLRGKSVHTEALAGSCSTAQPGAAARLLESQKDLAEHHVVVEALRSALAPLCSSLEHPSVPQIRTLRRILHLWTPLSGQLLASEHVLDLVQRLHPTPAVGGQPRESALPFLAEHEPVDRGWYAAPLGWVDLMGDGEFVVALRSALLDENRAQVFAGAGIVRDSRADDEFAETELKMASMLSALGLSS